MPPRLLELLKKFSVNLAYPISISLVVLFIQIIVGILFYSLTVEIRDSTLMCRFGTELMRKSFVLFDQFIGQLMSQFPISF